MKEKVQLFGRFLSGMVMPNIGAFIAWGLITALFIESGWLPNATLAKMVSPMSIYLLPLLIGYTGGQVVGGPRGGVIGAIGTMGVIVARLDMPMFIGAMIMGPLSAWVLKKFDNMVEGKIKAGFEMLVNNFSLGIIGAILACLASVIIAPVVSVLNNAMEIGVGFFVDHGLLPIASLFIEPAKVLFLNNAINQGILSPMGIKQVEEFGKSIFFLLEANPGPGLGVLLAYCIAGKGSAKSSAPGAAIIHFLGGIHEIYFPYILMNPLLLLAVIAGGASGIFTFTLFNVGLTGPASPGSIISILMMCERHSYVGLILGVIIATVISFVIALPLLRFAGKDTSLEDATAQKDQMKNKSKGISEQTGKNQISKDGPIKIAFACDAGMGSSAMGATVLKKKIDKVGLKDIDVIHTPVSSIPPDINIVVTHQELGERAAHSNPNARLILITNFLAAPEYDELIADLQNIRGGNEENKKEEIKKEEKKTVEKKEEKKNEENKLELLYRENIKLNCKPDTKENVIRAVGQMLVNTGYVEQPYVDAMVKREESFSTYMGNELALPHGVEEAKKAIKASGIAVMIFPEGTDWGEEKAKIVVGIAGVGEEHLQILSVLADKVLEEGNTDKLIHGTIDEVYEMLKGGE